MRDNLVAGFVEPVAAPHRCPVDAHSSDWPAEWRRTPPRSDLAGEEDRRPRGRGRSSSLQHSGHAPISQKPSGDSGACLAPSPTPVEIPAAGPSRHGEDACSGSGPRGDQPSLDRRAFLPQIVNDLVLGPDRPGTGTGLALTAWSTNGGLPTVPPRPRVIIRVTGTTNIRARVTPRSTHQLARGPSRPQPATHPGSPTPQCRAVAASLTSTTPCQGDGRRH